MRRGWGDRVILPRLLGLNWRLGSSISSSKTKIQIGRRYREAENCRAATELSCERPVEPCARECARWRALGVVMSGEL
jgi:hypothetical protein